MLGFFRTTDPYRLIWLFLLMITISLPWLISWPGITLPELRSFMTGEKVSEGFALYTEVVDSVPPLAAWFYGFCEWVMGKATAARHFLTLVVLFLAGSYYGLMLISKKAFPESTLLPSLIFGITALLSFDMLALTAELPAFVLLMAALKLLMDEVAFREQRDETILRLGLVTGLASLFVFSYAIFFPGILALLLLFTRTSLRRLFLMLFGFCLPHAVLAGYYYYNTSFAVLAERFYLAGFSLPASWLIDSRSLLILLAVPLAFLFISFFVLNRNAHLTKYQSQLLQIMLLWLVLAFIHFLIARDKRPQTFLPAIPSLAFILTHHFLLIKRKFAGFHLWFFLAGLVATAHLAQSKVFPVNYDELIVKDDGLYKDKRLLDLTGNYNVYLQNTPAPPLLDIHVTRQILARPNTFEAIILINHLFSADPPEMVIDPENYLAPFFQRIPALAGQYRRSGSVWIRVD